ncbi:hypothetical protein L3Y34_013970 [Caenorhabditis briggsae]|uniref:Uncharacterized protein n=1 Tax=Caenorhabditis briggsae TaxID=6238 RepID=A0AAE9DQI0_CAEBR|nr:hypothetical protein L3Y34_013970 [Caenorhabditis briggsae]
MGSYAVFITVGAIGLVSIIIIVAIVLFIKKNKAVGPEKSLSPKKGGKSDKVVKMEDGMVEIELDSQPGTQHATPSRR